MDTVALQPPSADCSGLFRCGSWANECRDTARRRVRLRPKLRHGHRTTGGIARGPQADSCQPALRTTGALAPDGCDHLRGGVTQRSRLHPSARQGFKGELDVLGHHIHRKRVPGPGVQIGHDTDSFRS